MSSKSERQHILAQIWSTPTPYELDFFDKGKEIIITCTNRDVVNWWVKILRSFFEEERFVEKNGLIKCRPAPKVTIKINKLNGALKVYGQGFWGWFMANFQQILEQGTADMESLSDGATDNSVTRFLQLDKNYDEVQDLLDTVPEGGGIMAHDFILRLWKSLLDDWFGVGASVYIVTPKIDPERLFNICLLMIRNKGTGFRVTLVTPQKNRDGDKFAKTFDTTKRLMKKTNSGSAQKKRLVSDVKMQWVLETLTIRFENFSTNFVAAFKDEEAEVMCTTAHFHKSHMQFEQKDNVSYSKLPTSELRKNYLLPLGIGNLGT